jgi:ATP synthase, F0 subunit b
MEKLISEFSSGLFFWQTIIFVTLIFLLRKYAWKPILDTVNEREKSIRDSLNSAKQAKKEMENLQAENKKILQEARAESDAMINQAKQTGKELVKRQNLMLGLRQKTFSTG